MDAKRNLFFGGLRLTLGSWPAFFWTYVVNLAIAIFFTLPLHFQIQAMTANSLASARLVSGFDLGVVFGLFHKLGEGPGPALPGTYFSIPVYLLLYFLIVPGVLVAYQTDSGTSLFTLLRTGFRYFWRFVRITLITLIIAGPIMAGVMKLENLWSDYLDKLTPSSVTFYLSLAATAIVILVAALLRVFFDLIEVYTVQLGEQRTDEERPSRNRQIRRAFKPAWSAFRKNFFRLYLSFVVLLILGLAAVALCTMGAMQSLAQPRTQSIFLYTQLGLMLMLFTRFWQRGAETILVEDNPIPEEAEPKRESAPVFAELLAEPVGSGAAAETPESAPAHGEEAPAAVKEEPPATGEAEAAI